MLAQLADVDHCAFIRDEIESHRPEGKLKALVFCRNVTHARQMAEALGEYYQTAYLTGKNTVGERIRAEDADHFYQPACFRLCVLCQSETEG